MSGENGGAPDAPAEQPIDEKFEQDREDLLEMEALGRIAHAFREYKTDAEWEICRWEYNYSKLSAQHQDMLSHIPAKIAAARQCVYQNHLFFKSMLEWLTPANAPEPLCLSNAAADGYAAAHGPQVNPGDADKVRYVLKNAMRDWSAASANERAESYGLVLNEVQHYLGNQLEASNRALTTAQRQSNNNTADAAHAPPPPRVLVPGCGLGRLCAELASLGFEAIGNEHSYFMLLASAYILNAPSRADQFTLFPWVHSNNNHLTLADQLRPLPFPDVTPFELVERTSPGLLGMVTGEFSHVFATEEFIGTFDAVTTCFFIDTAHNFIEYLETIWKALKPGGYWINLGPLQWHWADAHTYLSSEELSIEVSVAEVVQVAQRIGFVFEKKESGKRCRYMCNDASMMHQGYECVLWVAQKPLEAFGEGKGGGEEEVPDGVGMEAS